jgi:hypothetical protein
MRLVTLGRRLLLTGLVLTGLAVAPARADLVGLTSSVPGSLYSVNPASGAATFLTNLTGATSTSLVGLDYMNGTLYASDVFMGGFRFGSIDQTTGAFTVINTQGGSANWHGLAGNPALNLLYTVNLDAPGFPLLSVTPAGVISTIGNTNQFIAGLAYDSDNNVLYAMNQNGGLFTLNTTTGASTLIGNTGIPNNRPGLAYDTDADILYMNTGTGPGANNLYQINPATAAATLVGPNGPTAGQGIDGLAFIPTGPVGAVPEPSGLALGLAGALLVLGLRWRRRR